MPGLRRYRQLGLFCGCADGAGGGGRITDFCGSDDFLDGHHIIATNGLLHPLFLKLTGEVSPL